MTAFKESKALVQRAQKLSDKIQRRNQMVVNVRVNVYLILRKIVIIMMKCHVQIQMIACHHVLKRQDYRSWEIVISRVIFRNVFTLWMTEERRSHQLIVFDVWDAFILTVNMLKILNDLMMQLMIILLMVRNYVMIVV